MVVAVRSARAAAFYRALQVYGVIGSQIPFALTVYGLNAHLAREANPVSALFFALPHGAFLEEFVRLALTFSFITQSVLCWRLGERYRSVLLAGWATLSVWALIVTIDTLHDVSVLLLLLMR